MVLAAVPVSARHARAFVRVSLVDRSIPEPPLEDAVLLTGELVSNALDHARAPIRVRVVTGRQLVRIEVHDGSRDPPRLKQVPLDATNGRGLFLVERLADAWGVARTPEGKVVWFEISVDGSQVEPSPPGGR